MAEQPDYLYLDVNAYNYQSIDQPAPRLQFSQTRNNPVLKNAEDYNLSITRFQLDTFNLPTLIAEIQPNQGDRNLTIDSVTLEYEDGAGNIYTYRQYINWSPQNTNESLPPPPNATSNGLQYNTPYYYCYNFQYYIDLINKALVAANTGLIATLAAAGIVLAPAPKAPFLVWDSSETKATVYSDATYYDEENVAPNRIKLYFNQALYAHFNSLLAYHKGYSITEGRNYQLIFEKNYGKNIETISGSNYLVLPQEYPTIDTWTPINSIVFTSSSLPIVSTLLADPAIYTNNSLVQGANGNNSNIARIITDLQTNEMVYKPNLLYAPSAEYRRIALVGNQEIRDISIEIYWKDKFGRLNEFYLESGAAASLKILFEKKSVRNPK